MKKEKINIAFDIGTSSVGWSLITDNNDIVDMGVRLFPDAANPKNGKLANEDRRLFRGARRRKSRESNRKKDFLNLLLKNKIIDSEESFFHIINTDINDFGCNNPIELKMKLIKSEGTKDEIIYALFHYLQHRGYFYINDENIENLDKKHDDKIFPSELIYNFYKKNHYYKNSSITAEIHNSQYCKEAQFILEKNSIDKKFIDDYISLLSRKRDFSIGPGGETSPSIYGIYQLNSNTNKVEKKYKNIWEKTIGKCTYFPNEFRALKDSPIGIVFNFINDINTIYLFNDTDKKLSLETKQNIYKKINEKLTTFKIENLIKLLNYNQDSNISIENVYGLRINDKNIKILTDLKNYIILIKWIKETKLLDVKDIFSIETLTFAQDIFNQIASYNDKKEQLDFLNSKTNQTQEKNNIELIKKIKGLNKTHSLSEKAMLLFIDKCFTDTKNQMQFFYNEFLDKNNQNTTIFKNKKYFPKGLFNEEIISPTVRRSFNQTINIMNQIIKKYGKNYEINNIAFELARDKNSAEEASSIKKSQSNNKEIIKKISNEIGRDLTKLKPMTLQKIKLWYDQNKIDIYDGMPISIDDVIKNNNLEIDHIIPYSISHDDSFSNKVLTKSYNNKEKGNRTPYQWLSQLSRFENFINSVNINLSKNKSKLEKLLEIDDPTKNILEFVGKNLSDTRYASKLIMNTFDKFFKENNDLYSNVKIKSIKGAITNFARYNIFKIQKKREEFEHHAVDSVILNYLAKNSNINKLLSWNSSVQREMLRKQNIRKMEDGRLVNELTGEVFDTFRTFEHDLNATKIIEDLRQWIDNKKIRFTRMIIKKDHCSISKQTIFSLYTDKTTGTHYKKANLKIIDTNTSNKELDKYFRDGSIDEKLLNNLLCYKEDKVLYNKLKIIYNQNWAERSNPFINFMKLDKKVDNPKFIQIDDNTRVKKLSILTDKKDIERIITLKNHLDNKNKPKAFLEGMNQLGVRIYKNKNDKYVLLPLNIKIMSNNGKNKFYIDNKKLEDFLLKNNIENNKYIELYNGTLLIDKQTNEIFYSIGSGNYYTSIIAIQPISYIFKKDNKLNNTKKIKSDNRIPISIKSALEKFDIITTDILGHNVKKMKI